MKKKSIMKMLAILWVGLIIFLSSQPAKDSRRLSGRVGRFLIGIAEKVVPGFSFESFEFFHLLRKSAHFFVFMVLGVLVMQALSYGKKRSYKANSVISFGICLAFAILDEFHQHFVPGRGAQVSDIVLDSAGAVIGIGIWLLFDKWRRAKKEKVI